MKRLLFLVALICLIGLLFVLGASTTESLLTFGNPYHFLERQAIFMALGFILMVGTALVPLHWWQKTSLAWYGLGITLLVLVLIPGIGQEFNGARRWISVGSFFVLQPVEVLKLGIVLYFADWLSKHQRLKPWLFLTCLPVALIMLQPNLSSSLIIAALCFGMFFVAGGDVKYLLGMGTVALFLIAIAIFSSDYRMRRFETFINPESDPLGASFHIRQITLALGRGGIFGQGLGNSAQKLAYIPEPTTDSIFAITAEEVGFVGSAFIISLYISLLLTFYKISQSFPAKSFEQLLSAGILIWISLQTALNLAAVVALVPLTGVPLPYFSYGGSSLVVILWATGFMVKLAYLSRPKHI